MDSIERVAGHFRNDTPDFLLLKLGGDDHARRWWTGPDRSDRGFWATREVEFDSLLVV